jgi:uncharacterized protein YbcC (UPF0753/DUF2309 family)
VAQVEEERSQQQETYAQIEEEFDRIVAQVEEERLQQYREKHNLSIGQENVRNAREVSCLHT